VDVSSTQDNWGFDTPLGQVVSSRVDAEFLGLGEGGVERFELTVRFTKSQCHVYEAAYVRLGGVRVREIPDATNVAVDETSGDGTVTIDSPNTSVVADSEYVITEWESERLNDAYQSLSMTVAQK